MNALGKLKQYRAGSILNLYRDEAQELADRLREAGEARLAEQLMASDQGGDESFEPKPSLAEEIYQRLKVVEAKRLADSWVNGNRSVVVLALSEITVVKEAVALTAAVAALLSEEERATLVRLTAKAAD